MKSRTLAALTISLALGVAYSAHAQRGGRGDRGRRSRVPEASKVLESVKSLKCSFSAATTATWEGGEPQLQTKKSPTAAVLTIRDINVQDGTAEIGGGFRGGDNVIVKLAGSALHFLDISLNGTLGVVTVFAKETRDGRLQAVYSRASYAANGLAGSTQPEMAQYYGDCEIGS